MTREEIILALTTGRGDDRQLEFAVVKLRHPEAVIKSGYYQAKDETGAHVFGFIPMITTSVDAAFSLIPPGWYVFCAGEDRHSNSWEWELRMAGYRSHARAIGPARALSAAALLAWPA